MKIVQPNFTALYFPTREDALEIIETAGRTCYKSASGRAAEFVQKIVNKGHHSVIEHVNVTGRFIIDRGVSHELVRHRLAMFSQESTRYCNYSGEKFGEEITVINPCFWPSDSVQYEAWAAAMQNAEMAYMNLLYLGATAQEARAVLPNSLKTEVVMTANLREWRHVLTLRTSKAAHPQIREVMWIARSWFENWLPEVFYGES